ncbi:MAG: hypothetical protein ACE368_05985 [Paracoccaceae bacterium]
MTRDALLFSGLSLAPVPLIAAAAWAGGLWALAALMAVSVVAFTADELVAPSHGEGRPAQDFPNAHRLNWVRRGRAGRPSGRSPARWRRCGYLGALAWAATFAATGLYLGQVSNANAHELIHARRRLPFLLGRWVYISMLFGHHTIGASAGPHRHAASAEDPNSAKLGRGYYRFLVDAWGGSFRAALARHPRTTAALANPSRTMPSAARWRLAARGSWAGQGVSRSSSPRFWAPAAAFRSDSVEQPGLRRDHITSARWLERVGHRPAGSAALVYRLHDAERRTPFRSPRQPIQGVLPWTCTGHAGAHPALQPALHGARRALPAALAAHDGPARRRMGRAAARDLSHRGGMTPPRCAATATLASTRPIWHHVPMLVRALLLLLTLAAPVLAETPLSAEAFERYVTGKTLTPPRRHTQGQRKPFPAAVDGPSRATSAARATGTTTTA